MDQFVQLARLAGTQHGLLERATVLATGVNPSTLQRWLKAGRLQVVHPSVYRLAGAPVTWEQQVLAAVLASGVLAAASHRSAARLWGLLDGDDVVEISMPRRQVRHLRGVVAHRSLDLASAPAIARSRIPTTDPMRTLIDLGAVVGAAKVEQAFNRALEKRLLTAPAVQRRLDLLGRRGRVGAGVLRSVLDDRALGAERSDSELECRMASLLRRGSFPPAVFQYEVRHDGRFVARIDFAYPDLRLAIEVDGFEKHSTPAAFQSDLDRQNRLVELGWTVLRFTWKDVVRRPTAVAGRLGRVLVALGDSRLRFREA